MIDSRCSRDSGALLSSAPALGSIVDRFVASAARAPDAPLFTFVDDEGRDARTLTFAELDAKSKRLAAWLLRVGGVSAGDRVLLAHPPGLDFVISLLACLRTGIVGVPVMPPDPFRQRGRDLVRGIIEDCGARVALSTWSYIGASIGGRLRGAMSTRQEQRDRTALSPTSHTRRCLWLGTDLRLPRLPDVPHRAVGTDDVALLQYTSGSTSTPRGVVLTHGNLMHQLTVNAEDTHVDADSCVVFWVPQYHDFGLISAICNALFHGMRAYMLSPLTFIRRPAVWFEVMSRARATYTAAPNFAFDLAVRRTKPEQRSRWDLTSLRAAICAAEPIRPETVDAFCEAFAPSGFRREAFFPAYGLAEHTVGITTRGRGDIVVDRRALEVEGILRRAEVGTSSVRLAACGRPSRGVRLRIVDPSTHIPLAEGRVGEIWADSASKAAGYWRRSEPELFTARTTDPEDETLYLRTGDFGAWYKGQLYVTGRRKDVILIAGRNHHAEDVEHTVRTAHSAIRRGGIAAFPFGNPEGIGLLLELRDPDAPQALLEEVATAVRRDVLAAHDQTCAAVFLARPGAVLKTTSGKVRRGACARSCSTKDGHLGQHLLYVWAPSLVTAHEPLLHPEKEASSLHLLVRQAVADRLPESRALEDDEDLVAAGLTSLVLLELCSDLEIRTGRSVEPVEVLRSPTITGLVCLVTNAPRVPPAQTDLEQRPTAIQRAILEDAEAVPGAHVTSFALRIEGSIDREGLGRAVSALVARHQALRATFCRRANGTWARGDGPEVVQGTDATAVVELLGEVPETPEALKEAFSIDVQRPFDLASGPLLRAHLRTTREGAHLVHITLHHLAYDLVSLHILADELIGLLALEALGLGLPGAPSDRSLDAFAAWETQRSRSSEVHAQRAWWRETLRGASLYLPFPGATTAPGERASMQTLTFRFDEGRCGALDRVAGCVGVTCNELLCTRWGATLCEGLDLSEVIFGTTVSLRRRGAFQSAVGPFVNYVPLRFKRGCGDEAAGLRRAAAHLRDAIARAEVPLGDLIAEQFGTGRPSPEALRVRLGLNANYNFYDLDSMEGRTPRAAALRRGEVVQAGPLKISQVPTGDLQVRRPYDLVLSVFRSRRGLAGTLRFQPAVVPPHLAESLLSKWQAALDGACRDLRRERDPVFCSSVTRVVP